jgi:8-oxo-dGTP diphosphatase
VSPPLQRVVACVIRRGNRYLLCQRPTHKRHAGLWEFPGGKTHADESDEQAATRELEEELGVQLVRAGRTMFEVADPGSTFLIAFVPVEISGEPVSVEHPQLLWGTLDELRTLPLPPSDSSFVDFLLSAAVAPRNG